VNIHLIIDESGSMGPLRAETVSGFNKFLGDQQKLSKADAPGKRVKPARLHVTLFDTMGIRKPIWDKPIEDVKPWTEADYRPGAGTPLLDAVGDTLSEAKGKNALVVIITDGQENASRKWTKAAVKDLISRKQADGWTVIYLGANVDAFAEGGGMGVSLRSTSGYQPTAIGMAAMYNTVSDASSMSRSGISYTLTSSPTGDPVAMADPVNATVPKHGVKTIGKVKATTAKS
jgi:hypothetical protein